MKTLPLLDGCTLDQRGRDGQRRRLDVLRPSVRHVDREPGELRVSFDPDVDEGAVHELLAVERGCCSFLALDYDASEHLLRISSADRGDAVDRFAHLFTTGGET